ncbi:hypothetical protein [Saccharothrix xinjiangensis]|uniref:Secreted protein n=1 Tax=Saccharothrix xinjiangensis TaxID=204798 RepID=A0ABV9XTK6_9PSEU
MRPRTRAILCAAAVAAATLSAAPAASAAAGITTTWVQVHGAQYGTLWVGGTATCSTTSGTAAVRVSAFQILMHMASDAGSTTISCAAQPAQWSVQMSPQAQCFFQPLLDQRCFMTNSQATVLAEVVESGVPTASSMGVFAT